MDDPTLRRLEQANQVAAFGEMARLQPGGEAGRYGDIAWFASGLPLALFSQVQVLDAAADPADLGRAIERMRARGDPFMVSLRDGADDRFVPLVLGLGFGEPDPGDPVPAMVWHPIGPLRPPPAELEIRAAVDEADLDACARVAAEGFAMPLELVRRVLGAPPAVGSPSTNYLGVVNGAPVGAALGFRKGTTIGVYNVATIPAARRRGYGAAMTRRAIADGVAAGCSVAILQASKMGRSIYEAMGFRVITRYREFQQAGPGGVQAGG